MALTYTPAGELGSPCPDFDLPTVDGARARLSDFADKKALLVMFICNHCPYVKAVEDRLIALARRWQPKDVAVVAICANDPTDYPEDAPAELLKRWKEKNYGFPYLIDEEQNVAKAFGAVCTPDFFLYGSDRRLAYRGRLDDSWRDPQKVTKEELSEAIEALLEGKPIASPQNPSMGCSIKWKNE